MPVSHMPRPAVMDGVANTVQGDRDRAAGAEILHPHFEGRQATFVDPVLLRLGFAETEGALDMGKVAAELRMNLADDQIAAFDRPRRRQTERMRIGQSDRRPTETASAPRRHWPAWHPSCRHRLPIPSRRAAPGRDRSSASCRRACAARPRISSSSSLLTVRSISIMSSRLTNSALGSSALQPLKDAMRKPAVRIERPGKAVHADARLLSPNSSSRSATESAQVPRRARISETQSWAARQPSIKVGIMTKLVGSPFSGKTRTLNSALPPIGDK